MPQRASQRKFGRSLKLHLAKQKKHELMYVRVRVRVTQLYPPARAVEL